MTTLLLSNLMNSVGLFLKFSGQKALTIAVFWPSNDFFLDLH